MSVIKRIAITKNMQHQYLEQIPITQLHGVGPKLAEKLTKLNIYNISDLLFHLPVSYQDRTRLIPISNLQHNQEALVQGQIVHCDLAYGKKRSLILTIKDGQGYLKLRFFHFSQSQQNRFNAGTTLRCFGQIKFYKHQPEMVHPEYRVVGGSQAPLEQVLTANYPLTEGVTQGVLRRLMAQTLEKLAEKPALLEDWLAGIESANQTYNLKEALTYLHAPPPDAAQNLLKSGEHPAQARLAFEELVAHHLSILTLRKKMRAMESPILHAKPEHLERLMNKLPFALTKAQARVRREIENELTSPTPMLRMVQGDVGSGKTILAAMAALQAVGNGFQVALMAPTELLSEQHLLQFQEWLGNEEIVVAGLSAKITKPNRERLLKALKQGKVNIVIGTHALFQERVEFRRLGLIIIDEQHRFGVHQRYSLRKKANQIQPHTLILTATPIPRTLAMSLYGDLDISILDELPKGRQPVNTIVLPNVKRQQVIDRVRDVCKQGRQAYWVCTLIEESDLLEAKAAQELCDELTQSCPDIKIGLIHGKLKPDEKTNVMSHFKAGDIDLLIATTVIEVGVDVPNASIMIIENPERLGLAQLHQLRGRVGRGSIQSHCLLLYHGPLSKVAKSRLAVMRDTTDGFVIAEKDLELRGPGEIMGLRQTGVAQLKVADLTRDHQLLIPSKKTAAHIAQNHPDRIAPLINRWLGYSIEYAQA